MRLQLDVASWAVQTQPILIYERFRGRTAAALSDTVPHNQSVCGVRLSDCTTRADEASAVGAGESSRIGEEPAATR